MQSDSDSEGEFFDAAETQNNGFDAISTSKPNILKTNTLRIEESVSLNHTKTKEENEILPQGKLKTQDDTLTQNTCSSENNQNQSNQNSNFQSSTSKVDDNQHNSQIIKPQDVEDNIQKSKVSNLELTLIEPHKKDFVDIVKTRSSSIPLSPVSEVLQSVVIEEHSSTHMVDTGGQRVHENETPTPIAPPRRKRKKKVEAKITTMQNANEEPKESEKPSSTVSTPETLPTEILPCSSDPVASEQLPNTPVTVNSLEGIDNDPAITLDYKSTEMKQVLEKASSTEVIPALSLDAKRKSNSVTSLGSTCNRSDSFTSASSVVSNGPIVKKTGSSTSVSSIQAFQHSTGNHGLVRVRSESGRPLSDTEILEQVIVKNLDTGESIPLSLAEDTLPKGTNPLALHIMRLTSEYSSNSKSNQLDQEDGPEVSSKVKKKTKKLKSFLGRTVNKMKAEKKIKEVQRGEESSSSDEEESSSAPFIKIKSAHGKGPEEFEKLKLLQDLSGEHVGAIWTVKFSVCGRLMATAGQDHMVRVWVLKETEEYFEEMRKKYSKTGGQSTAPDPEVDQILEQDGDKGSESENEEDEENEDEKGQDDKDKKDDVEDDNGPFIKKPFCTYYGHTGDVLDLSWSKNYFLLSSSMDKTVRLWHISRTECLCCFQHIDFVTAIVFHPRDDRYFLSGSLDGKIRLWNIPDKKVALWNEVEGTGSNLITAANFCLQGRFAVVGTYDGRCIFYETERLKYHTQWQVSPTRSKRSRGRKISGIEPMPGEEKVLITSNDSRIRLYDLKDNSLSCKYKGCTNSSSQIKASFSHDGQYLICGSEDHFAYIWRTQHGLPSARRDKNEFYESFSAHSAVVTVATFTPVPWLIVAPDTSGRPVTSEVLVTADWTGAIKLFVNR